MGWCLSIGYKQFKLSSSRPIKIQSFLTLSMNEDYTFSMNEDVSFLVSRNGTWVYWIDGDEEIIRFKFKNAKDTYPISGVDPAIVLERNLLKDGRLGDKIVFKPK